MDQCGRLSLIFIGCLAFFGGLTLIFTGVYVARPGIWAQNFKMTTCTAVRNEELNIRGCDCSTGGQNRNSCSSKYPCVQVFVKYNILQPFYGTTNFISTAHINSIIGVTRSDCFYIPTCSRSSSYNTQSVDEILKKYATVGSKRSCLYNPENPREVIFIRSYERSDILAALVIPGVITGFFIVLFLIVFYVKYRTT